jgi:hypothetical protein
MKNVFMYSMFIIGTMFLIGGVYNFLPFEIKPVEKFGHAYKYGHAVGYVIGKFLNIVIGVTMIKYGYETYLERKIIK